MSTLRQHWKLAMISLPCWMVIWAVIFLAFTQRAPTVTIYSVSPAPQHEAFGANGLYTPGRMSPAVTQPYTYDLF